MTLISRNALKKSVTAIFSVLVILSIMLAVVTLIAATGRDLQVKKTEYGILDLRNKEFTPFIDDIMAKEIVGRRSGGTDKQDPRIRYSEILENINKSLRRYSLETIGTAKLDNDFFTLTRENRYMDLNVKLKRTLSKKYRTVRFTINWKNIIFGTAEKDGEEREVVAINRNRLKEEAHFDVIDKAYQARKEMKATTVDDISDYDMIVHDKNPLLVRKGKIKTDKIDKEKIKKYIDSMDGSFKLYRKDSKPEDKEVTVRVYELNDEGTYLVDLEIVKKGESFKLNEKYKGDCGNWFAYPDSRTPAFDDEHEIDPDKNITDIISNTYIYGVMNGYEPVKLTVKHNFEFDTNKYDDKVIELTRKTEVFIVKKGETLNIEHYDVFHKNFNEEHFKPTQAGYKRKSIGYELVKTTVRPGDGEAEETNELKKKTGIKNYEVSFYYNRKEIELEAYNDQGNKIDDLEKLGLKGNKYKFGDEMYINDNTVPYGTFKRWKTESGNVKNEITQGRAVLDENFIGSNKLILRAEVVKEEPPKVSIIIDYYVEKEKDEYERAKGEDYKRQIIREYVKGSPVSIQSLVKTKTPPDLSTYEQAPQYWDAISNTEYTSNVVDRDDIMNIHVRFKKIKTKLHFKKSKPDNVDDWIDDDKFNDLFDTESAVLYGAKPTASLIAKNAPNGQVIEHAGMRAVFKRWVYLKNGKYVEFDLNTYENKDKVKDLDIYAEWENIAKFKTTVRLADLKDETYASTPDNPQFDVEYEISGIASGSRYSIKNTELREKLKAKINEELTRRGWSDFDTIFDMSKLEKTIGDEEEVSVTHDSLNLFTVRIERIVRDLNVEHDFSVQQYSDIAENIKNFAGTDTSEYSPTELIGAAALRYNIKEVIKYKATLRKDNAGKFIFKLKDFIKDKYKELKIGINPTNPQYQSSHFLIDKVAIQGNEFEYDEASGFEVEENDLNFTLRYIYKPNTFKLNIVKGGSDPHNYINLNNQEERDVMHLRQVLLKRPINSEKTVYDKTKWKFNGWQYEDGTPVSDGMLTDHAEGNNYLMPGTNVTLKPSWVEVKKAIVKVALEFEQEDGSYQVKALSDKIIGPDEEQWALGQQIDVDEYTKKEGNPINNPTPNFTGYDYDEEGTLKQNSMRKKDGKLYYTVDTIGESIAKIKFRLKRVNARFIATQEYDECELPEDINNIKFGSNVNIPTARYLRTGVGGVADFRGWSLEDRSDADIIAGSSTFKFDKEEYFKDSTMTFYARWKKLEIDLKANVQFEKSNGGKEFGVPHYIDESEFVIKKIFATYDGQEGEKARPNNYRDIVFNRIKDKNPFADAVYDEGDGSQELDISEDDNVFNYTIRRKQWTFNFRLPAQLGNSVTTVKALYGAKIGSSSIPNPRFKDVDLLGINGYAEVEHWTREVPGSVDAFIQSGAKFDIENVNFDDINLYNNTSGTIDLYPVWGAIKKLATTLQLFEEKSDFSSESDRWELKEFKSSVLKTENDEVDFETFKDDVLTAIDERFNSDFDQMQFKLENQVKDKNFKTNVKRNLKLQYYVARKKVRLTLSTQETPTEIPNVTVADSNNRILEYRYGQKPNHAVPSIPGTATHNFINMWLDEDGFKFKFNGDREVNKNMTLSPVYEVKYAKFTIEKGNMEVDEIYYEDEDATAEVVGNKIEVTLPITKYPYSIKGLKSGNTYGLSFGGTGVPYDKTTQRPVHNFTYTKEIVQPGDTSVIQFEQFNQRFVKYYPQTKTFEPITDPAAKEELQTYDFVAQEIGNIHMEITNVYYKGEKYEKVKKDGTYHYFKYEQVFFAQSEINTKQKWAETNIDVSFFTRKLQTGDGRSYDYDKSYLKAYVENVVRKKMMCEDIIMPTFEDDYDVNSSSNSVLDEYTKRYKSDEINVKGITEYVSFIYDWRGLNNPLNGTLYKEVRGMTSYIVDNSTLYELWFTSGLLKTFTIKSNGKNKVITFRYWQRKFVFNYFEQVIGLRVAVAN